MPMSAPAAASASAVARPIPEAPPEISATRPASVLAAISRLRSAERQAGYCPDDRARGVDVLIDDVEVMGPRDHAELRLEAVLAQMPGVPLALANPFLRLVTTDEQLDRAADRGRQPQGVVAARDLLGEADLGVDRGVHRRFRIEDAARRHGALDQVRRQAIRRPVVRERHG